MKRTILYRPMFGMEVKQDVDTLLYNLNDVLKAYNKQNKANKQLENYMKSQATKEYIELLEEKSNTPQIEGIKKSANTEQKSVIETRRGKFGGTRVNQHLVVDFMMRLSPEFKHLAIEFILEGQGLALGRNSIKKGYKAMMQAIADSGNSNYREEATMLNVLNTGSPAKGQRARYDSNKMDLMDEMQKTNASLIIAGLDLETRKNVLIKQYLSNN